MSDNRPRPHPTLSDVAEAAGVSSATVSRCLNAPERVAEATRARVEAAVAALGYTPHFAGMALASKRTNTVGAVIPTMDNAIFARALQAMEETLAAEGVTLLVASSGYDPEREALQVRALLGRGVDGLLLIGAARPVPTYALLEQRGVPLVLAWTDRAGQGGVPVGFDNAHAAKAMAERVLDLGHRHLAMIAGLTTGNDRATARVAGVRAALGYRGLALAPERLIEAPYTLAAGEAAFATLMAQDPRPTAVLCGNDVLAAGALRAARALGLAVPGAVSITGFDDIDLAEAIAPGLTTVHVPHRRMGRFAAGALLALRAGQAVDARPLETHIVMRASLGGPPAYHSRPMGSGTASTSRKP